MKHPGKQILCSLTALALLLASTGCDDDSPTGHRRVSIDPQLIGMWEEVDENFSSSSSDKDGIDITADGQMYDIETNDGSSWYRDEEDLEGIFRQAQNGTFELTYLEEDTNEIITGSYTISGNYLTITLFYEGETYSQNLYYRKISGGNSDQSGNDPWSPSPVEPVNPSPIDPSPTDPSGSYLKLLAGTWLASEDSMGLSIDSYGNGTLIMWADTGWEPIPSEFASFLFTSESTFSLTTTFEGSSDVYDGTYTISGTTLAMTIEGEEMLFYKQ